MNSITLALLANLSFAFGSQFFTHYTRKVSALWMNSVKAFVAMILFGLYISISTGFNSIDSTSLVVFLVSGFIALGIGDIFLLQAFSLIGPGRTMLLFGFHPVLVGVLSYLLLGQAIEASKLMGILFFIICLIIFSLESYKVHRKWDLRGLVYALLGVTIDGIGILITRYGFDMSPKTTAFEGNFYRCIGALLSYILISRFIKINFISNIKNLNRRSRFYVFVGALFGTTISLGLYLKAIQISENLAALSGITITSVIFAALFECIHQRKMPSKYLISAFFFFCIGMKFVLFD